MEISRNSCRLCLSENNFNVSLFGSYSRKTSIIDKILVCLKVVIDETDLLTTICYRCAGNVERYHDFITTVKKGQNLLKFSKGNERRVKMDDSFSRRHVTSYVREQVVDADYTFSFLEMPEEKTEKSSSPFFSYFSPPNVLMKEESPKVWKKPRQTSVDKKDVSDRFCNKKKLTPRLRNCSRDIFDTQSQEEEQKGLDWKLTPEDNIIKRVREKIFGRTET